LVPTSLKPQHNPKTQNRAPVISARRAAFEILRRVEHDDAYSSVLLAALDEGMRVEDRALCHELVLGVLRRRLWIDRIIEHLAKRKPDDLDLAVKLALRLGIYQLHFLSRIPPSAAVNESVNLVRSGGVGSAAGLVNAVLRRAIRESNYDPIAEITDPEEKLAVESSHPQWLITRWVKAFGLEEAAALARSNNEPAPVAFRLTTRALALPDGPDQVIKELETSGAELSPSQIVANSWRVKGGTGVLRRFARDGLVYVQDEASQLVAHVLGAQPNQRVLDVCAAPGSKTMHTDALAPQSSIVSGDRHVHRLRTLSTLASRQGVVGFQPIAYDATRRLPFADDSFDCVMVDAPCSGTGTLRHNPEIRWRITAADIGNLAEKQTLILANASQMVRPGGRLVYSTCSVEPEENESVVGRFLDEHDDFASAVLDTSAEMQTETGAIRTWPHRQDVDGFFIKAFDRRT
jgi:16S rRNA (cytosine967-C5)-methyltransferase